MMPYWDALAVFDVAGVTTTVYHANLNNMQWLMVVII